MRRQKSKLIQNISCNLQDATKLFSTGRNKKYIFPLNEEIPSYKSWFLTSCMISPELCSIQIYCEHLFMVNKMRKLYSLWLKLFIMLNNKMTKLQNIRNWLEKEGKESSNNNAINVKKQFSENSPNSQLFVVTDFCRCATKINEKWVAKYVFITASMSELRNSKQ